MSSRRYLRHLPTATACSEARPRSRTSKRNNPVERGDAPVRKRSRGKAAQLGELHAIIEALKGHRMEAPPLLSIATGMRRGEIAALRESHVDVQATVVRVCESIANGGKGNVFVKATKTDEPRNDFVARIVAKHPWHQKTPIKSSVCW
jgi:integrase